MGSVLRSVQARKTKKCFRHRGSGGPDAHGSPNVPRPLASRVPGGASDPHLGSTGRWVHDLGCELVPASPGRSRTR